MTTMRFGLSATAPGQEQLPSWDADWTAPVADLAWSDGVYSMSGGASMGLIRSSARLITSGVFSAPAVRSPGREDSDEVATIYGGSYAYVTVDSFMVNPITSPVFTEQWIALTSVWDSIKNIAISAVSMKELDVSGFVDTLVTAPTDNSDHTVNIEAAKRGAVTLGNGNDHVQVDVAANEYTWSSHFAIVMGNGNDVVHVMPEANAFLATLPAPHGWTFNSAPQLTTADIVVGNGNDTVSLAEVSGRIHVGSGNDTIDITDGNSTAWLGSGNDTVTIGSHMIGGLVPWAYDTAMGTSTIYAGSGHADITIDDTTPALTPLTTLCFVHGKTGGGTLATADVVRYGHADAGTGEFVGGDLAAVSIEFSGYSAGSTATLSAHAHGGAMLLQIHDAATGSVDALALYGARVTNVASLNLRFD